MAALGSVDFEMDSAIHLMNQMVGPKQHYGEFSSVGQISGDFSVSPTVGHISLAIWLLVIGISAYAFGLEKFHTFSELTDDGMYS
jgi:hypothetical protein